MNAPSEEFTELCRKAQRAFRRQQYAEAAALFQQAVDIDADSAEAQRGLASAHFLLKNYDQAVAHFIQVTRLAPRDGRGFINLGAVYNCQGDHRRAVEALLKGVQRSKKNPEGFYDLGIAYRKLGQTKQAISAYKEAIRLNPRMAEAHQNLANVYVETGNLRQAVSHYRQALEVRPEFDRARRGLAHAQQLLEESRTSTSPFGRLVELDRSEGASAEATAQIRRLSPDERFQDRVTVNDLTTAIVEATRAFHDHLKNVVEPRRSALDHAVFRGEKDTRALETAYAEFHEAVARLKELRADIQKGLTDLAEHERSLRVV